MNDKGDVTKEQYEAWASTYDRDKAEIIRRDTGIELEEFVEHILDNCQLKKGQKILDVGIGTGLVSVSISKRLSGNCKILGIDITDAMLAKAKNNIKMESLEHAISLKKASAENIPVKNSFYNLVVCVFVIRHTNIEKALSIHESLKTQRKRCYRRSLCTRKMEINLSKNNHANLQTIVYAEERNESRKTI